MPADPIYRYEFAVPAATIDQNGHVNNVIFVQWMQDAAVQHFTACGGTAITQEMSATWVVRTHTVEYFLPAFAGEVIEVHTWVADIRRVRSLRRYRFIRKSDGRKLVEGATDWVLVDAVKGNPIAIPETISALLPVIENG
jgi:acyl-CoA thioester hydrolase